MNSFLCYMFLLPWHSASPWPPNQQNQGPWAKISVIQVFCHSDGKSNSYKVCLGPHPTSHEWQCNHQFSVNKPTICIKCDIFKQKYTQNKVIYWLNDENVVTRGLQKTNPVFLLGPMVQYLLLWCSRWFFAHDFWKQGELTIHLCTGLLFGHRKEWDVHTWVTWVQPWKQYAKWKK
jgi:hypothetical protein